MTMSYRVFMVFVVLSCVVVAPSQSLQQQAANLDKMIQHYRNVESQQGRLLDELNRGAVIMIRMHEWSDPIPMRTSDLRDYIVSLAITAELGRDKPDVEAAEKRALTNVNKVINGCKENVEKKRNQLQQQMSQVRTSRQKAERKREQLRLEQLAAQGPAVSFSGHWNSSVGRFGYPKDLTMSQKGNEVSGNWTHRSGSGTLKGTVKGNVLTFTYTENWASNGQSGTDTGKGSFTLSSDGKRFFGTYTSDLPDGEKGNGWRGGKAEG